MKKIHKKIDYTKIFCVHSNGKIFNFNPFRRLGDFVRGIYSGEISLKHAIARQKEMEDLFRSLSNYKPKNKQTNKNAV